MTILLGQLHSNGTWRSLDLSTEQIRILSFLQHEDHKNIVLFALCFEMYLFYKNLIVLHHGDYLFYKNLIVLHHGDKVFFLF